MPRSSKSNGMSTNCTVIFLLHLSTNFDNGKKIENKQNFAKAVDFLKII